PWLWSTRMKGLALLGSKKGLLDGTDCISTECQSSVLGEKRGGPPRARDSLRLSTMGGESSRPESTALPSRMLSSSTVLCSSSSKYFVCACFVSTVRGPGPD